MLQLIRVLGLSTLAISVAECSLVYPAYQGVPATPADPYNFNGTTTDSQNIISTVYQVDQRIGATPDAPPDLPVQNASITAIDGDLVNTTVPSSRRSLAGSSQARLVQRDDDVSSSGYDCVFSGTGTDPGDRDASIEGTYYLSYTLVKNSTYNVDDCLAWCNTDSRCAFVNLYYEFNNELLDHVFSQQSNLKCVAYGDVYSAAQKTNFGGQSLSGDPNGPLTYIQQSSGWAKKSLCDPPTPSGYEEVPNLVGANVAPGYMGFVFLDQYDVTACAAVCNSRGPDSVGGACQYFNIWRALVNDTPTTYTCALYYIPTDNSTAINYGQGNLVVSNSRGYKRKSYILDGGFEDYTCPADIEFCWTGETDNWIGSSPKGGTYDATVFHWKPYAHSGNSSALLGSAYGSDDYNGTLTPAARLDTEEGVTYVLDLFFASFYSGQQGEESARLAIYWNDEYVGSTQTGYSQWTFYRFEVVGQPGGNDKIAFVGGSAPSYVFVDDVCLFEA